MLTIFISMIDEQQDQSKFEKIYYEYHKDMLKIAYHITKEAYLAEEVVQDSLYTIAKNISRIKTYNAVMLRSYIFKLVKNAAINTTLRDRKILATEDIEIVDISLDVEEIVSENEAYNLIVRRIASLPSAYRDILTMNIVNGLSTKEIAILLNIKHSTVKSRLTRGTKMLKTILEEAGIQ